MKRVLPCILALLLFAFCIPVSAATSGAAKLSFSGKYNDVKDGWYRSSVDRLGYPEIFLRDDGGFHPDRPITRMEFARLLHKALGISINYFAPIDIGEFYSDVDNASAGAAELYDLVSLGIIDKKDLFEPEGQLPRDEMAHYAVLALRHAAGDAYSPGKTVPAPFGDDKLIGSSYKATLNEAVSLKLVNGKGDNLFQPRQATTRAEAVTVAVRLLDTASALLKNSQVVVKASAVETGGNLRMSLSIANNTAKTVTIRHTSGQRYDFMLLDAAGETLYCWSADKMFTMALTNTVIKSGEKREFTETLDSAAYSPIKNRFAAFKAYITGTSEDFSINPDGY